MIENLSYYHIFYEVATTQNLSKAAQNLYISQPAVTKSIKKLEENLNLSLFIRTARGVHLTPEGKILYEHVKSAFSSLTRGEQEIQSMLSLQSGSIRIGVSTTLCKYILLPHLQEFIHKFPQMKVSIFCQSSNETLKLLEDNQIDFGLIGEPLTHKNQKNLIFHSTHIIQDTFVCNKKYSRRLFPPTEDFEQRLFQTCPLFLLNKDNMSRQYMDHYFLKYNIIPSCLLEISTMDLLIEFAKIGVGVACVIRNFIQEELHTGQLIELPFSFPIPTRNIGYAYFEQTPLSLAAKQFLMLAGLENL